ncbi:MAG: hypothetical protein ABIP39_12940 [Polyangiaceae bacterium]
MSEISRWIARFATVRSRELGDGSPNAWTLRTTVNIQYSIEGVRDWLDRATRYSLSPAVPEENVPADELDARDPELAALVTDLFRGVGRALRLRVEGVEKVPRGAALLVGNHRCVPLDSILTAVGIADQFGAERPLYAWAHPLFFQTESIRRCAFKLGLLRAAHGGQERALRKGALVLVHPRVARRDFIRVALREQVPVVPVFTRGLREHVITFGAPLRWLDLPSAAAEDDHAVRRCYLDVETRMKALAPSATHRRDEPDERPRAAERHLHVVRF